MAGRCGCRRAGYGSWRRFRAFAIAQAGSPIGHAVFHGFATGVGAKPIDRIPDVPASPMPTVRLPIDNPTAHNALTPLVGAIAGIVALSTGPHGETGRVILHGGAVVAIAVIVATVPRRIGHVARVDRVGDTVGRSSAPRPGRCAAPRGRCASATKRPPLPPADHPPRPA